MSEGYTIDGAGGEVAGIVVRQPGERAFRFHSAARGFDALNGHVFVSPQAAQRAARDCIEHRRRRPAAAQGGRP